MRRFNILVASDYEMNSLISESYKDITKICGIGIADVLGFMSINDTDVIINVGYCGSTSDIQPGTIVLVDSVMAYYKNYKTESILLDKIDDKDYKHMTCYTSTDFVTDETRKNMIFDMELLPMVAVHPNDIYSIKIVSDNGNMDDYNKSLLDTDNKDEIKKIIDSIIISYMK
jgi:hypothetical protein